MDIKEKKILIFGGKNGLLGQCLVVYFQKQGASVQAVSSLDVNYAEASDIAKYLAENKSDIVVNAVAYTAVDLAEKEEEKAYFLNVTVAENIAKACIVQGSFLIHYSTDFVFSGEKDTLYTEEDEAKACSVYGKTKLLGEQKVLSVFSLKEQTDTKQAAHLKTRADDEMQAEAKLTAALLTDVQLTDSQLIEPLSLVCNGAKNQKGYLLLRISWVFGLHKSNFLEKIMAFAKERDELKIVADQFGSPSFTEDIAKLTHILLEKDATGLYHMSNSGKTNWYEFAKYAIERAGISCSVKAIKTEEYPTPAKRPVNSALSINKLEKKIASSVRPWQEAVDEYVQRLLTRK